MHPKIAREWNKERNGDPKSTDVIASSNKRVWWKCKEGHEWPGLIANRARRGKADPGCPYCSGRKVLAGYNDLAATHPDIAAMWHPRMNKRLKPTGVQAISRKPAWWRGECGHVYQMLASIYFLPITLLFFRHSRYRTSAILATADAPILAIARVRARAARRV